MSWRAHGDADRPATHADFKRFFDCQLIRRFSYLPVDISQHIVHGFDFTPAMCYKRRQHGGNISLRLEVSMRKFILIAVASLGLAVATRAEDAKSWTGVLIDNHC